jgi:hypothetical protein
MNNKLVGFNKIGTIQPAVWWNQESQKAADRRRATQKNPDSSIKTRATTTTGLKTSKKSELQPKKLDDKKSGSVQERRIQKTGQPHRHGECQESWVRGLGPRTMYVPNAQSKVGAPTI